LTLSDFDAAAWAFDYRGVVNVPALADRIAEKDREGENRAAWAKTIGRWITEKRAPEPETIRRVLGSLGFDWLIGLGLSGYKQHAIAMLHVLYSRMGSRSRVAAQARAIFTGSDYERNEVGRRSRRAFVVTAERAQGAADPPHLKRLDDAAMCWRDGRLPTRCVAPGDLFASESLYAAWVLLDNALVSRFGDLQRRMRAIDEIVAREVQTWADSIGPREQNVTRLSRRSKVTRQRFARKEAK
jgi:hypothetical protein